MHPDALEYFTYTHPRRSSDYALRAVLPPPRDGLCGVYAAADMIDHPMGLRWRHYMKTAERLLHERLKEEDPADFDSLYDLIASELVWHSRQISGLRDSHDADAFGFCLSGAAVLGARCRVFRLGDCRAYHVRRLTPRADRQGGFEVRCLTRDQNALGFQMAEEKTMSFFRNELIDLSKHLGCFMGIQQVDLVEHSLRREFTDVTLAPGECLLLATDGLYMPHLRALLDACAHRITEEQYYLEAWFGEHMARAHERIPPEELDYWPEIATMLIEATLEFGLRRYKYNDDIAVVGLYVPEE